MSYIESLINEREYWRNRARSAQAENVRLRAALEAAPGPAAFGSYYDWFHGPSAEALKGNQAINQDGPTERQEL